MGENSHASRSVDSPASTLLEIWDVEGDTREERIESAIEQLGGVLKARADRETGLVTLMVRDARPDLTCAILTAALEFVNVFNTQMRQSQASAERRFVAERLETLRAELREAESAVESFLVHNRNFSRSPQLQFEYERLQREVTLRQQVVISLAQAHERARMDEVRNTPVITIVDPPRVPVNPHYNWLVLGPLLGLIGGVMVAGGVIVLREWFWRGRANSPEQFSELSALTRAAAADLRLGRRVSTEPTAKPSS
jgi:uncharacterized protein involved in exopolysaccharide biosynthesis